MAAKRLWLLDVLRGAALLNMLAYHALYDWVYVFGHTGGWYDIAAPGCHIWQQYICWSFILLSGYSFTLARRPLKNGLLTVRGAAPVRAAPKLVRAQPVLAGPAGSDALFLRRLLPAGAVALPVLVRAVPGRAVAAPRRAGAPAPAAAGLRGAAYAAGLHAAPARHLRRAVGVACAAVRSAPQAVLPKC